MQAIIRNTASLLSFFKRRLLFRPFAALGPCSSLGESLQIVGTSPLRGQGLRGQNFKRGIKRRGTDESESWGRRRGRGELIASEREGTTRRGEGIGEGECAEMEPLDRIGSVYFDGGDCSGEKAGDVSAPSSRPKKQESENEEREGEKRARETHQYCS